MKIQSVIGVMRRDRRTFMHKMRMMLWALSAVVMVACVREDEPAGLDPDPNGGGNIQSGIYDLYFRIQYDSNTGLSTRAGDLVDGEHREHEIGEKGNFLLLFAKSYPNATGNARYTLMDVLPMNLQNENGDGKDDSIPIPDDDPDKGKVEAIFQSRIDVVPNKLPKKCLVVLNGLPLYDQLMKLRNKQATLEDVLNMTWRDEENPRRIGRHFYNDNNDSRFVMTNSAYFIGDDLQIATDLESLNLDDYLWVDVDDEDKFKELNEGKKTVRIYVERMVSKFTLEIPVTPNKIVKGIDPETGAEYYDIYPETKKPAGDYENWTSDKVWVFTGFDSNGFQIVEQKKWRARVWGWGVNAIEKESYVFKRVSDSPNAYKFPDNWSWIDGGKYRTYWAEDTNYEYDAEWYPWQYRDAIDRVTYPKMTDSYSSRIKDKSALLENQSYEYFSKRMQIDRSVYVPENTYDYLSAGGQFSLCLDGRPHLLAGTHIIICAELQICRESDKDYTTFTGYRDRIGNFYWADATTPGYDNTKECFIRLMRTFNYYLSSQKEMRYVYYEWPNITGNPSLKPGDVFYAKPGSTVNLDDDGQRHRYEIFWEETEGDSNTAKRMFNDDNEFLLDKYHFESYFTPAYIKDGDGKVLPWVDGLRIYDVKTQDVASIPVYEKSDQEIADLVEEYIKQLRIKIEAEEESYDSWVSSEVDKEVFYALKREEYKAEWLKTHVSHYVTVNDRRSLLLDWLNSVDYFCEGMMYYAAEVKNPAGSDYENAPYGTVRNNWYQFTLKGINSIGTSLAEHEEPIVPNRIFTNDQINFDVRILHWKEMNMGNITLP